MSEASGATRASDAGVDGGRAADELVLLTTQAMRARRHPRAIVAMWAWQTALALLASWPVSGLAAAAWSGSPSGDAALWAPGGHALLDWLWHDAHGLSQAARSAELVLVVGAVAGLVPMAALMIALAYATRDRSAAGFVRCLSGGLRAFPQMMTAFGVALLAQGAVAAPGFLLARAAVHWARPGMGEARAQQIEGLVLFLTLALVSAVGVVHDLARAAVVRFRVGGLRAFALGARTFRLAPASLWWSWAWRAAASVAPVLAVGVVAGRLGGRGGFALAFLAVLHQSVVLARVALRASWLARALRAVDDALRRAK